MNSLLHSLPFRYVGCGKTTQAHTENIFVSYVMCVVCSATVSALAVPVTKEQIRCPYRHVTKEASSCCFVNTATGTVPYWFLVCHLFAVNNERELPAKSDRMDIRHRKTLTVC